MDNKNIIFFLFQPEFFRQPGLNLDSHHSFCGPDVTLATNAMSTLVLHHHGHHGPEPDSPDLVSMDGGPNVLYSGGGTRYLKNTRQKRHSRTEHVSADSTCLWTVTMQTVATKVIWIHLDVFICWTPTLLSIALYIKSAGLKFKVANIRLINDFFFYWKKTFQDPGFSYPKFMWLPSASSTFLICRPMLKVNLYTYKINFYINFYISLNL